MVHQALSIQSTRAATTLEWATAAKGCEYATFFHTPEWALVVESAGWRNSTSAPLYVEFSDTTWAVIPRCIQYRFGIFPLVYSSATANYGGWISPCALTLDHAKLLRDTLCSSRHLIWRLNPYDSLAIVCAPPRTMPDFTYTFNLQKGATDLFKNASHGHRQAVKKAIRRGVSIRVGGLQADWDAHFLGYQSLISKWKKSGLNTRVQYNRQFFSAIAKLDSSVVRLWVAEAEGEIIASWICFYWNKHIAHWHSGGFEKHFNKYPNNLLFDTITRDACERGFTWFDMNPSGGFNGTAQFKLNFGALAMPAPIVAQRSYARKCAHFVVHLMRKKT